MMPTQVQACIRPCRCGREPQLLHNEKKTGLYVWYKPVFPYLGTIFQLVQPAEVEYQLPRGGLLALAVLFTEGRGHFGSRCGVGRVTVGPDFFTETVCDRGATDHDFYAIADAGAFRFLHHGSHFRHGGGE